MSQQLNFKRLSQEMKEKINEVMNLVADRHLSSGSKRGDALHKLCMLYIDNFASKDFKEIPPDIQGTIDAVDCAYIKYDTGGSASFLCFESYHKNKKTHPIESEHDKVINACMLCKKGKSDAIRYRIEEGFRKKGINNVFNLTKLLLRMDVEGAVAQIFLCQAKQFTDDEIIISPDCVHMKCPQLEGELVLIDEYCVTQIDPDSMNPPCRWLIAPFLRVPIKPAPEAKAVMEEMKRLADESNIEETSSGLPKEVEAIILEPEPVEEAESEIPHPTKLFNPIEEGEPIPIEEDEPIPIEEDESIAVDLDNPLTARDIIAKEKADALKKKPTKKKKGDKKDE